MNNTPVTSPEIVVTKLFSASKEVLMRVWGNPEHLTQWWGPEGFTTTTHEMEFRTGGLWRFTMHGPDGTDYPNLIRYRLVTPDRIEFDHSPGGGDADFRVEVTFSSVESGTQTDFRMIFPSIAEKDRIVKEFKADEGIHATLGRLDSYATSANGKDIELVIVRRLKAPLDLVWKAITDPDQINQWCAPGGFTIQHHRGELEVGQPWSMAMTMENGYSMEMGGEFTHIISGQRLSFTHRWKNEDGSFKPTTQIDYHLTEKDGMTTLTFVQTGFWSEEARAAHLGGWSNTFHNLAVMVGSTTADKVLVITREFAAPIERVWKAWTDPTHFCQWFAPRPYTCPVCRMDLRAGGELYLEMESPQGLRHPMVAEITDIEPLESFGWICSVPGPTGEAAIQGGTNVRFEDLGGSTRVTVHAYNAAFSEIGAMMIGGMEPGWNASLDQMVQLATQSA